MTQPPRHIIGIDPGFTGGVSILDLSANQIQVFKMPIQTSDISKKRFLDAKKLAEILRPVQKSCLGAVIEQVSAAPRQGVVSVFSFGQGYGTILGVLAALGISVRLIHPSVWKSNLGLTSDKQLSLNLAAQLFPELSSLMRQKKNDGLAESVILAHYGKTFFRKNYTKPGIENLL